MFAVMGRVGTEADITTLQVIHTSEVPHPTPQLTSPPQSSHEVSTIGISILQMVT